MSFFDTLKDIVGFIPIVGDIAGDVLGVVDDILGGGGGGGSSPAIPVPQTPAYIPTVNPSPFSSPWLWLGVGALGLGALYLFRKRR